MRQGPQMPIARKRCSPKLRKVRDISTLEVCMGMGVKSAMGWEWDGNGN